MHSLSTLCDDIRRNMKRNEKFAQLANDSLKQYENNDVKRALLAKNQKRIDARKNEHIAQNKKAFASKYFALSMTSVACVLLAVVSLVCVYFNPTDTSGFADGSYPYVPVSLEEINDAIFDYKIAPPFYNSASLMKDFDNITPLMYDVDFSDSEEEDFEYYTGMFKLSVNSYLFEQHSGETSKKAELPFGSFNYNEEIEESQDDGVIFFNYHVTAWGVWKNRMLEFEFECITIYEDHCNPTYLINQVMCEKTPEEKARQLAPLDSVEKWIPFAEGKTTQTIQKQSGRYDGNVLFLTNLYKKIQKVQSFFKSM